MNKEFLNTLKVGDKVGVSSHYHGLMLTTIKRITKTLIVTENDQRFNKDNGYAKGSVGFFTRTLIAPTEEFYKNYYRHNTQII
ncbi:MAG: hypothetical protein M0R03_08665 [Novosphingobium sp.]|nr:hypothetical protein [Novosphingobium sp.]